MDRDAALRLVKNEALWGKVVAANAIYASLAGSPQEQLVQAWRELSGERAELQPLLLLLQAALDESVATDVAVVRSAGEGKGEVTALGVPLACVQHREFILFQGSYELLGLCTDEELARLSLYLGAALYAREIALVVLKQDKAKLVAAIGQDSYRFVMDYARYATGALSLRGMGGSHSDGEHAGGEGSGSIGSYVSVGSVGSVGVHQHYAQSQALQLLDLSRGAAEQLRGFFMQQGRALLLQVVQQFTDPYLKELLLMRLGILADAVLAVLAPYEQQDSLSQQQQYLQQRQATLSYERIYNLALAVLKRGDEQWTQCLS